MTRRLPPTPGRFYGERFGRPEFQLSPADLQQLVSADWPGNVRQLENTIARMVALGDRPLLSQTKTPGGPPAESGHRPSNRPEGLSLREQVEALERGLITRTLAAVAGNQSEAARRLGLGRGPLIDRMRKYGLLEGRRTHPRSRARLSRRHLRARTRASSKRPPLGSAAPGGGVAPSYS